VRAAFFCFALGYVIVCQFVSCPKHNIANLSQARILGLGRRLLDPLIAGRPVVLVEQTRELWTQRASGQYFSAIS
jgi:hypothetical protein